MTDYVIELRPAPFEPVDAIMAPSEKNQLRVLEIYRAAGQGEGIYTGAPSVFVRLAGCTVGCTYCDTKYSWRTAQGQLMDINELVEAISGFSTAHVVITGGEPMEHPERLLHILVSRLLDRNFFVTIETSGTRLPSTSRWNFRTVRLLWSVAPKLAWSGARFQATADTIRTWIHVQRATGSALQFKWVCRNAEDVAEVFRLFDGGTLLQEFNVGQFINFIQTATDTSIEDDAEMIGEVLETTRQLQEFLSEFSPALLWARAGMTTMVRPQLHVLMYGKRRLV